MGDIPASLMDVVRTTEGLTLKTFESTQIRYLLLNTTIEPFNDINVRKALLEEGINRAEIAEVVYGEFGGATASVLSAAHTKVLQRCAGSDALQPRRGQGGSGSCRLSRRR